MRFLRLVTAKDGDVRMIVTFQDGAEVGPFHADTRLSMPRREAIEGQKPPQFDSIPIIPDNIMNPWNYDVFLQSNDFFDCTQDTWEKPLFRLQALLAIASHALSAGSSGSALFSVSQSSRTMDSNNQSHNGPGPGPEASFLDLAANACVEALNHFSKSIS